MGGIDKRTEKKTGLEKRKGMDELNLPLWLTIESNLGTRKAFVYLKNAFDFGKFTDIY